MSNKVPLSSLTTCKTISLSFFQNLGSISLFLSMKMKEANYQYKSLR